MRISTLSFAIALSNMCFHALYALAAGLYPGGTFADRSTVGYSFWENYLCDVLVDTARNGQPNPAKNYGIVAFFFIFLTLTLLWILLHQLFPKHIFYLKDVAIGASLLSTIGLLGTVMTSPLAGRLSPHVLFVALAVLSGLVATILPLVGLLAIPEHRFLGKAGLVLLSPAIVTFHILILHNLNIFPVGHALIIALHKISLLLIAIFCFLPAIRQLAIISALG